MEKLKPCPFCGNEVEVEKIPLWYGNGHGYSGCYKFKIECKSCGCTVDQPENDSIYRSEKNARENAIKAWNRRVEIRCKDCHFFHKSPRLIGEERNDGWCEWINERLVEQDHYCSWGIERSEE